MSRQEELVREWGRLCESIKRLVIRNRELRKQVERKESVLVRGYAYLKDDEIFKNVSPHLPTNHILICLGNPTTIRGLDTVRVKVIRDD